MVDANIEAIFDHQSLINFSHNGVIRVSGWVDEPQAIIISIKVNDIVFRRV